MTMAAAAADAKPKMSSRPIWTGSINFGLVTIPVKLFTAVRERRLQFRSLHDQDKVPLKQKLVCPADGKEVHPEHIVKGFEIEKDRYVVVRQEELDAARPKSSKAVEIQDFVALDEIDPVFFDKPYYVVPKPEGAKPYRLLLEAMRKKGKVGIAKVVLHTKEYLAALRPAPGDTDLLCLETMHFADEVLPSDAVDGADLKAKVDERELKVAQQLIDALTGEFKPERYRDEYREKVMELIERKARGERTVLRPEATEAKTTRGADLIAALEASLATSRAGGNGGGGGANGKTSKNGHSHTHRRRKSA